MKYFTKYLPVEGEIYQMDKYMDEEGDILTRNLPSCDDAAYEGLQKVTLFLCSRDIQVGDKVWDEHNGFYTADVMLEGLLKDPVPTASLKYVPVKVIGEISSEATWVKEGDEFDEDDLHIDIVDPRLV